LHSFSKKTITFLAVFSVVSLLSAQAGDVPADDVRYRIVSVDYDIHGQTREYALSLAVPVDTKTVFIGKAGFDSYITDLNTLFVNERVLDSVRLDTLFGEASDDGIVPVQLVVHTVDTWNIIALPYPKYDSNSGFQMKLKLKDYNFLGSMQVLTGDIVYEVDNAGKSTFATNVDFGLPFKYLDHDFEWKNDISLSFPVDEVPNLNFSTGLAVEIPVGFSTLNVGLTQSLLVNDRDDDDMLYAEDPCYAREKLAASLPIKLYGFERLGELDWTPNTSVTANWSTNGIHHDDLKGPRFNWGHSIGAGRVDWHGNFRQGASYSVSNDYSLNLHTLEPLTVSLSTEVAGYASFFERFGISSRLTGFYNFHDKLSTSAADNLRGILNDRISTDTAFTLNLDLPVKVLYANFYEITGVSWTRFIGFEMHASPFFDMAVTHDGKSEKYFSLEDGWYSGGMEIIVYPMKMRSIYARVSVGYDLGELSGNGWNTAAKAVRDDRNLNEYTLGIGLFY